MRDYAAITTMAEAQQLVDTLMAGVGYVAFDVETGYTSPEPAEKRALDTFHKDFICVGFSITNDPSWARYVPLRHDSERPLDALAVWEMFRPVLETKTVIAHHKKFEDKVLRGLPAQGDAHSPIVTTLGHDSMLVARVLGDFKEVGLKALSLAVLGHTQRTFDDLFRERWTGKRQFTGAQAKRSRFNALPLEPDVIEYACEDAALCLELFQALAPKLTTEMKRVYQLERAISGLMVEAESYGVAADWGGLAEAAQRYETFRPRYETYVREEFKKEAKTPEIKNGIDTLNFGSAVQMRELLYGQLGFHTTRKTASGEYSTDAQALETLSRVHPAVRALLDLREIDNLGRRVNKWLTEYSGARDGRIHASFSQTQVVTGRFSANDPALQQLPKDWGWSTAKDSDGKPDYTGDNGSDHWSGNFRKFIRAGEGRWMGGADYSQIELRVLAGVTQEPTLLRAFKNGEDPHTATAAMMLGKPVSEVTKAERAIGKTCIAAGQLVRTDRGLVPIEDVRRTDKVWDGSEWVSHDGVIFQGVKDVLTAHGLSATPDHKIVMSDGSTVCWGYASAGRDFASAGDIGEVGRLHDGGRSDLLRRQTEEVHSALFAVRGDVREVRGERSCRQGVDLRVPESGEVSRSSRTEFERTLRRDGGALSSRIVHGQELRGSRDRGSVRVQSPLHFVGLGEPSSSDVRGRGHRPRGQRWALRVGESSAGYAATEPDQQANQRLCGVHGSEGCPSTRVALVEDRQARLPLLSDMDREDVGSGTQPSRNLESEEKWSREAVYDIVNAGPRHRFVVSDFLVLNCSFAMLYGMGPRSMAERLAVSFEEAKRLESEYKSQFTNIDTWVKLTQNAAPLHKHVTTWFGRRVPLFGIDSPLDSVRGNALRLAVNAQIQGGAADYVKLAMLRAQSMLQKAGLWGPDKVMLTMNQHDALYFEAPNEIDPNEVKKILTDAMVFEVAKMLPGVAVPIFPDFEIDWEFGTTWGGAAHWGSEPAVWDEAAQQWRVESAPPEDVTFTGALVIAEPNLPSFELIPPVVESAPEQPVGVLVVTFPFVPPPEKVQALQGLVQERPGSVPCMLTIKGMPDVWEVGCSSLTALNSAEIQWLLGSVECATVSDKDEIARRMAR